MSLHVFSIVLFLTLPIKAKAMLRALNTAATGMAAQESNVNTMANNIANVNTIGFKKQRVEFEDLMYETVKDAGARSSSDTTYSVGVQVGSGAKVSSVKRDFRSGSPQQTNNPLDLMINGDGFFAIIEPNNQISYTRDGSFSVDSQGVVVTKNGYRLFPGLTLPPNTKQINITINGNIEAFIDGQVEPNNVGQIPVFTFINPAGLSSKGGNLYQVTRASGAPIQQIPGQSNAGRILQGTLETSNVSIMNEMTDLIKAQRAYEMNSRVMNIADQMLQTINNIR